MKYILITEITPDVSFRWIQFMPSLELYKLTPDESLEGSVLGRASIVGIIVTKLNSQLACQQRAGDIKE